MNQPDLVEAIARIASEPRVGLTADDLERLVIDAGYWINAENTPLEFAVTRADKTVGGTDNERWCDANHANWPLVRIVAELLECPAIRAHVAQGVKLRMANDDYLMAEGAIRVRLEAEASAVLEGDFKWFERENVVPILQRVDDVAPLGMTAILTILQAGVIHIVWQPGCDLDRGLKQGISLAIRDGDMPWKGAPISAMLDLKSKKLRDRGVENRVVAASRTALRDPVIALNISIAAMRAIARSGILVPLDVLQEKLQRALGPSSPN